MSHFDTDIEIPDSLRTENKIYYREYLKDYVSLFSYGAVGRHQLNDLQREILLEIIQLDHNNQLAIDFYGKTAIDLATERYNTREIDWRKIRRSAKSWGPFLVVTFFLLLYFSIKLNNFVGLDAFILISGFKLIGPINDYLLKHESRIMRTRVKWVIYVLWFILWGALNILIFSLFG
ncbi:hypothetical protein RT41_GL001756 [Lactococcus fujiensis JCM 16395]|uniref:Uncharacterized protein n=2 Tax=Lactococcus fujiensis TaxID=610251 RepID=A0A2A5RKE9_9LACT|nr:hypothetical protein RT41_GL001756 [Lactococcus fujiensis JCM 16395]